MQDPQASFLKADPTTDQTRKTSSILSLGQSAPGAMGSPGGPGAGADTDFHTFQRSKRAGESCQSPRAKFSIVRLVQPHRSDRDLS